jgi:Na+/H+ antiporter NhaD/arsenite permease-like protein
MQKAFAGSAKALVLAALRSGISKKDREEIEKMLKEEEMSAFIFALGMTLMHFLWQGLLLGCATAIALALLRNSRAEYRYWSPAAPCWPACAGRRSSLMHRLAATQRPAP